MVFEKEHSYPPGAEVTSVPINLDPAVRRVQLKMTYKADAQIRK